MGALALLADSFEDPQDLNRQGYNLYCKFRPPMDKWGGKSEVKLSDILDLRPGATVKTGVPKQEDDVKQEDANMEGDGVKVEEDTSEDDGDAPQEPPSKRRKVKAEDDDDDGTRLKQEGVNQDELAQFMDQLDDVDDDEDDSASEYVDE